MKHTFSEILGKKGGEKMSGTTTGLGWIQRTVVLVSVLLFIRYQAGNLL